LRYKISHWNKLLIPLTKSQFRSPQLQEILSAQPAVLIGLIAHITVFFDEFLRPIPIAISPTLPKRERSAAAKAARRLWNGGCR
jgi:hypothetical protein